MQKSYGALIVATGSGDRLKQKLIKQKYPEVAPLTRAIDTFQEAGVRDITIISQKEVEASARRSAAKRGVRFLSAATMTDPAALDHLALFKLALQELQGRFDRLFIVTENTPFFTARTVEQLMEVTDLPASPSFKGKGGHPLLIADSMIPAILAARSASGMRGALVAAGLNKNHLPVDDEGCLVSITHSQRSTRPGQASNDSDQSEDLADHLIDLLVTADQHPVAKLMIAGSQTFFGPGAAQLLRLIDETGSVREASERMGISYSKAWKILRIITQQTGEDAVIRKQGGADGGSAHLSEAGRLLLDRYTLFDDRCREAVQQIYNEIFGEG